MSIFGRSKRRKRQQAERERLAREQRERQQYESDTDPQKIGTNLRETEGVVRDVMEEGKPSREEDRERFRTEARQDATQEMPGMSEQEKGNLRAQANVNIGQQTTKAGRRIAGAMGTRGVRGPAAGAAQRDVERMGLEARNQFERDLLERDSQVSLQRLAAYMASLEGKTGEDLLRRQQVWDYITSQQDRARQSYDANRTRRMMGMY